MFQVILVLVSIVVGNHAVKLNNQVVLTFGTRHLLRVKETLEVILPHELSRILPLAVLTAGVHTLLLGLLVLLQVVEILNPTLLHHVLVETVGVLALHDLAEEVVLLEEDHRGALDVVVNKTYLRI